MKNTPLSTDEVDNVTEKLPASVRSDLFNSVARLILLEQDKLFQFVSCLSFVSQELHKASSGVVVHTKKKAHIPMITACVDDPHIYMEKLKRSSCPPRLSVVGLPCQLGKETAFTDTGTRRIIQGNARRL